MNPTTGQHETRVGDTVRVCFTEDVYQIHEKIYKRAGIGVKELRVIHADNKGIICRDEWSGKRLTPRSWIRVRKGAK